MKQKDKNLDFAENQKRALESLKNKLETDEAFFNNWAVSDKRYKLISNLLIFKGDIENTSGRVTEHVDFSICSDSPAILEAIWGNSFFQRRYDSTTCHFIADLKEQKIVKFLSVCL